MNKFSLLAVTGVMACGVAHADHNHQHKTGYEYYGAPPVERAYAERPKGYAASHGLLRLAAGYEQGRYQSDTTFGDLTADHQRVHLSMVYQSVQDGLRVELDAIDGEYSNYEIQGGGFGATSLNNDVLRLGVGYRFANHMKIEGKDPYVRVSYVDSTQGGGYLQVAGGIEWTSRDRRAGILLGLDDRDNATSGPGVELELMWTQFVSPNVGIFGIASGDYYSTDPGSDLEYRVGLGVEWRTSIQ